MKKYILSGLMVLSCALSYAGDMKTPKGTAMTNREFNDRASIYEQAGSTQAGSVNRFQVIFRGYLDYVYFDIQRGSINWTNNFQVSDSTKTMLSTTTLQCVFSVQASSPAVFDFTLNPTSIFTYYMSGIKTDR